MTNSDTTSSARSTTPSARQCRNRARTIRRARPTHCRSASGNGSPGRPYRVIDT
ncbi:hypothetical protein [Streptomyces clavuligerus]|uniref:hypothetical protein n=1 Tax=Streptomyces clavuligerus TaxID=1901 RepID=UPI0013EC4031|nr:hypothetical protein [Streptomyces clavuligerus]